MIGSPNTSPWMKNASPIKNTSDIADKKMTFTFDLKEINFEDNTSIHLDY
jgi:hypothetical protein